MSVWDKGKRAFEQQKGLPSPNAFSSSTSREAFEAGWKAARQQQQVQIQQQKTTKNGR